VVMLVPSHLCIYSSTAHLSLHYETTSQHLVLNRIGMVQILNWSYTVLVHFWLEFLISNNNSNKKLKLEYYYLTLDPDLAQLVHLPVKEE